MIDKEKLDWDIGNIMVGYLNCCYLKVKYLRKFLSKISDCMEFEDRVNEIYILFCCEGSCRGIISKGFLNGSCF